MSIILVLLLSYLLMYREQFNLLVWIKAIGVLLAACLIGLLLIKLSAHRLSHPPKVTASLFAHGPKGLWRHNRPGKLADLLLSTEHIREMVCVFDVRRQAYTFVNPYVTELLGYTPEEFMRLQPTSRLFHPEDRQRLLSEIAVMWRSIRSGSLAPTKFSGRVLTRDGSTVYLETICIPVFQGNRLKIIEVSRDMTDHVDLKRTLHQTGFLYRNIVENSYNIILTLDRYGVVTFVNQAIERMGIPVQQFRHTRIIDWVYSEDREALKGLIKRLTGPTELRVRISFQNTIQYMNVHLNPLWDNGTVTGILCIALNITEQVGMEEQLRASEEKYRSLYDDAQVGLLTIRGQDGQILMANQQAANLFGLLQVEDLTDYHIMDLCLNPGRWEEYIDTLHKQGTKSHVFHGVRSDGQARTFEVFCRYNRHLDQIDANLVDITDKTVWERHMKYQAHLLENIQESVVVVSLNGSINYMNRQARLIFGCQNWTAIPAYTLSQRMYTYDHQQIEAIKAAVEAHKCWQGEISLVVDGRQQFFMHRINPLEENGVVTAVVIISTDINDLVEARARSESANMAKSQFLANMSHEIRTPMIGILGSVDLLEQSSLTDQQIENVKIIRDCGEQLLAIINDILDVSKIEIGLLHLHPQPCNLLDLLTRTLNMIDPLLKDKGLSLHLDIDPHLPQQVVLDSMKLRQVLLNLLYNAVKFTHHGSISLQVRISEGENQPPRLELAVGDTGIGIPKEQIQSIFAPFTQADNSTSRGFGGTGLGLYICKRLVELMEGDLWVESMEGEGTTFSFQIPLLLHLEEPVYEAPSVLVGTHSNDDLALEFNPIEILLVEDNDLNRKIVTQMLLNYGFQVTAVSNGLECLKSLQSKSFDTILMDMQMPIMDGYEATRLIREMYVGQPLPIIAMTANALTGDREKCLAAGCTSYIAKPFKAEDLVQEIRHYLQVKQSYTLHSQAGTHQQLIQGLLPEFMGQLEELVADLYQAVHQQDLSGIQSIGHDIKGTAGMYGFSDISHLASAIEQAARDRSMVQVRSLLSQMDGQLNKIQSEVG